MTHRCLQNSWNKLESALGDAPPPRMQSHRISKRAIISARSHSSRSTSVQPVQRPSPLPLASLSKIYKAKCEDMNIPVLQEQESRFVSFFLNNFKDRHFHMKDSGLGLKSAAAIGRLLKTSNFAYVHLGKNSLANEGVFVLLKGICDSQTIAHLDVSNNEITPEGMDNISKILKYHPSLMSIDLASYEGSHRNRLGVNGALQLLQVLKCNQILQVLNLSGTALGDGIEHIASGLVGNTVLVSLDVSNNSIVSKHMEVLAKAIVKSGLKKINLSSNKINDDGCEFLANMMIGAYESGCPLVDFDLSNNLISSKGAGKLFHGLRLNNFIKTFNLSGNTLTQGLSLYFPSFLADNCWLTSLNISNCFLKPDSLKNISEALNKNKSLQILNLSKNKIEDEGLESLADGLTENLYLKQLDISTCHIKGKGSVYLAKILKTNKTIECINLKDNSVKDEAGELFADLTRTNRNILTLNLDLNPLNLQYVEQIKKNLKTNMKISKKQQIPRIKKEIEKIKVPKEAFDKLNEKIKIQVRLRKEAERKFDLLDESFEEVKEKEEKRTKMIQQEHRVLREKNVELSKVIEHSQSEMIKLRIHSQKHIDELDLSLKIVEIDIGKKNLKRNELKENGENAKGIMGDEIKKASESFRIEEMGKKSMLRVLNGLKSALEEKKKEVEAAKKAKFMRIPAQFLASEKLAMNKRKLSPTKLQRFLCK